MDWSSEPDDHELTIHLQLPEGWRYEFERPFELAGWKITLNGSTLD